MANAMRTRHLASMLTRHFTVPVIFGATSTRGRLKKQDTTVPDENGGMMRTRLIVLMLPTAALPSLTEGSVVTVDGTSYTVRDQRLVDDGEITQYRIVPT